MPEKKKKTKGRRGELDMVSASLIGGYRTGVDGHKAAEAVSGQGWRDKGAGRVRGFTVFH